MESRYWKDISRNLRNKIEEKHSLMSIAYEDIKEKYESLSDNKHIKDLKSVVAFIENNEITNNKDIYHEMFNSSRISISPKYHELKQIFHLINTLGIQIYEFSLYKIKDISIVKNYGLESFIISNVIEKFKDELLEKIEFNELSSSDVSSLNIFYHNWDTIFRNKVLQFYENEKKMFESSSPSNFKINEDRSGENNLIDDDLP